jgi:hypothetical protein
MKLERFIPLMLHDTRKFIAPLLFVVNSVRMRKEHNECSEGSSAVARNYYF